MDADDDSKCSRSEISGFEQPTIGGGATTKKEINYNDITSLGSEDHSGINLGAVDDS